LTRRNARIALRREAMAVFGVFVLLLNILAGFVAHVHYAAETGLALSLNGGKIAICSGSRVVFIDGDGNNVPANEEQGQRHKCACCMLMKASAVMPPPPHTPKPLYLAAIQISQPGGAKHFHAVAVPTRRNRDPPSHALA
jgi:Protein of unknown function (DUF2946)